MTLSRKLSDLNIFILTTFSIFLKFSEIIGSQLKLSKIPETVAKCLNNLLAFFIFYLFF